MTELLSVYHWTIAAGVLTSVALALIGSQLASRSQSVQALVISQGSSLGAVAGFGFLHLLDSSHDHGEFSLLSLPLAGSLLAGSGAALLCEKMIRPSLPARNSHYIALFAIFLSLTYLVTALVPSLETHMATQYFGDLAVITDRESQLSLVIAFIALCLLGHFWRTISAASFEIATFGRVLPGGSKPAVNRLFVGLALITICVSIQFMGLLFTISALFLVPVILSHKLEGLWNYTIATALIAAIGTVSGFILSLWHGSLPTVPAITLSFLLIGACARLMPAVNGFMFMNRRSLGNTGGKGRKTEKTS
mgnify:CR=1 FL=1